MTADLISDQDESHASMTVPLLDQDLLLLLFLLLLLLLLLLLQLLLLSTFLHSCPRYRSQNQFG